MPINCCASRRWPMVHSNVRNSDIRWLVYDFVNLMVCVYFVCITTFACKACSFLLLARYHDDDHWVEVCHSAAKVRGIAGGSGHYARNTVHVPPTNSGWLIYGLPCACVLLASRLSFLQISTSYWLERRVRPNKQLQKRCLYSNRFATHLALMKKNPRLHPSHDSYGQSRGIFTSKLWKRLRTSRFGLCTLLKPVNDDTHFTSVATLCPDGWLGSSVERYDIYRGLLSCFFSDLVKREKSHPVNQIGIDPILAHSLCLKAPNDKFRYSTSSFFFCVCPHLLSWRLTVSYLCVSFFSLPFCGFSKSCHDGRRLPHPFLLGRKACPSLEMFWTCRLKKNGKHLRVGVKHGASISPSFCRTCNPLTLEFRWHLLCHGSRSTSHHS